LSHELELTKANRLRLAAAFRHHKRVDYSIDCVLEGQMGRAFVDDLERPTAYRITIGPFWYFAGAVGSVGGQALLTEFPAYNLLMPSPPDWVAAARETFGDQLVAFPRYSFAADRLSEAHLTQLLDSSPHRGRVVPIDLALLAIPNNFVEIEDFDSPDDFLERGIGYTMLEEGNPVGAAYSSLVCSRGIEVSLFVDEHHRRRGVATALAARLLLECARRGLRPNWDAANPESCKLALKLGYVATETYDAYYHSVK
jgi:GNAT superfamily N-acetyltransferase